MAGETFDRGGSHIYVMTRLLFTVAIAASLDAAELWRNPGPVASLDLAAGPGGQARAPRPPFTFVKDDPGGTTPKIVVRDARGVTWSVKFGPEVKAETFASRIVWAAGYIPEPTYYVRDGVIQAASSLGRAAEFVRNGRFRDARFELRDESFFRLIPDSHWNLNEEALRGSKELAGLKLLIMLLSNWDVKDENMSMAEIGGKRYYVVTDWGAAMGSASAHGKWDCGGFVRQTDGFVSDMDGDYVIFNYTGKQADRLNRNIRVSDVKWFMERMGKLTDAQIRTALKASGATAAEISCFTEALKKRLAQLQAIADGLTPGTSRTVTKTTTIVTQPK